MDDRTPEVPLTDAEYGVHSAGSTAAPRTHEQRLQTKLTLIAWSAGVLAVLAVLQTIGSLVALSLH